MASGLLTGPNRPLNSEPGIKPSAAPRQGFRVLLIAILTVLLAAGQGVPAMAAGSADLVISVAGPNSTGWSTTVTYTYTIENNGPDAGDGAQVVLQTSGSSMSVADLTCTSSAGASCPSFTQASATSISATLSQFPSDAVLTVRAKVKAPASGSSYDVSGNITSGSDTSDPIPGSNDTSVSTSMAGTVEVTKTGSPVSPVMGEAVTYTLTVTNPGPTDVADVTLGDELIMTGSLNATWTRAICTGSGGAECPAASAFSSGQTSSTSGVSADVWLWQDVIAPSIPADGVLTITYQVTYTDPSPHCGNIYRINNTFGAKPAGGSEDSTTIWTAPEGQPACPTPTVTKVASKTSPAIGETFTWTMTVANNSTSAMTDVKLLDALQLTTRLSASWTTPTCTAAGGAVCPATWPAGSSTSASSYRIWDNNVIIPSIPVGGRVTITMDMTLSSSSSACGSDYKVYNTFLATDSAGGRSSATATLTPPNTPVCATATVTKTASTTTPALGEPVDWTIVISNSTTTAMTDLTLRDMLVLNTTTAASWTKPVCVATGGAVCPPEATFTAGSTAANTAPYVWTNTAPSLPIGGKLTITYQTSFSDPNLACGNSYRANNSIYVLPTGQASSGANVTIFPKIVTDLVAQSLVSPTSGIHAGDGVTLGATIQSKCGTSVAVPFSWQLPDEKGFVTADPLADLVCVSDDSTLSCPTFSYDPTTRVISATFSALNSSLFHLSLPGKAGIAGATSERSTVTLTNGQELVPATNTSTATYSITNTRAPLSVTVGLRDGSVVSPEDLTFTGTVTCDTTGTGAWSVVLPAGQTSITSEVATAWLGDSCTFSSDGLPSAPAGYHWDAAGLGSAATTVNSVASSNPPAVFDAALILDDVSIQLEKVVAEQTYGLADTLHYRFTITNIGNVALHQIQLTDDLAGLSAIACDGTDLATATLAPTRVITCTATYQVTQTDVDARDLTNTAVVTALGPDDQTTRSTDDATASSDGTLGISLTKTVSSKTYAAGDTLRYTFEIRNLGTLTLVDLQLEEGMTGLSNLDCGGSGLPNELAPAPASISCTADYTATQADVDAGRILNTAIITASDKRGDSISETASASSDATPRDSGISLSKSVAEPSYILGDSLHYSFRITNTGNLTLDELKLSDPLSGLSAISCDGTDLATARLAPGQSITCTASYTATQADVDRGSITNTAKVTATDPSDSPLSATGTATTSSAGSVGLSLAKTVDRSTFDAGDQLKYTFVIQNTGKLTLHGLGLADQTSGTGSVTSLDCGGTDLLSVTLAPAAVITCTAKYTTTAADFTAGGVKNTATVTGTGPSGQAVSSTSSAESAANPVVDPGAPALSLVKSVDQSTYQAGTVLHYSFKITNDGAVPLTNLTLSEEEFTGTGDLTAPTCQPSLTGTTLEPGQSVTCTSSYTTTQADLDAGRITNTAKATGTDSGGQVVSGTDAATTIGAGHAEVSLTKTVDQAEYAAGDTLTYHFLITNDGDLTLSDLTLNDDDFSGSGKLGTIDCDPPLAGASLAPGGTITCTATYQVTTADVAAGQVDNTATVSGTAVNQTGTVAVDDADSASSTAATQTGGEEKVEANTGNPMGGPSWPLLAVGVLLALAGVVMGWQRIAPARRP